MRTAAVKELTATKITVKTTAATKVPIKTMIIIIIDYSL